MNIIKSFRNLSKFELMLWIVSVLTVIISFLCSSEFQPLTLIASLIGVTALIFVAKGDVLGQILTVVFSVFYAVISYKFRYFGEMITYLGMTAPMAVLAAVEWFKNPYAEKEVKVAKLTKKRIIIMISGAIISTAVFYFILRYFKNANLIMSTVSITTSFLASYLTFCRSPFYALAYASNDIVLIILWIMATIENPAYLPMIICFVMFFCNDFYGFINWQKMQRKQKNKPVS